MTKIPLLIFLTPYNLNFCVFVCFMSRPHKSVLLISRNNLISSWSYIHTTDYEINSIKLNTNLILIKENTLRNLQFSFVEKF